MEIRRLSRTEVAALGPQAGVDNSAADEAGGDADDADADTTTDQAPRAARKTSKTRKAAPAQGPLSAAGGSLPACG